jgi:propanol-preferring alcohol dehydrogenase
MVFGQPLPFTGSHEPAGEVVAVGSEVTQYGNFVIGSRVAAVNTARWCKECPECKYYDVRDGAKQHMIGLVGTDGAFADYCVVDASRAALIPESMTFEQARGKVYAN